MNHRESIDSQTRSLSKSVARTPIVTMAASDRMSKDADTFAAIAGFLSRADQGQSLVKDRYIYIYI